MDLLSVIDSTVNLSKALIGLGERNIPARHNPRNAPVFVVRSSPVISAKGSGKGITSMGEDIVDWEKRQRMAFFISEKMFILINLRRTRSLVYDSVVSVILIV